jgi:hypothetical protein
MIGKGKQFIEPMRALGVHPKRHAADFFDGNAVIPIC